MDVRKKRLGISKTKIVLAKCEAMWVSRAGVRYPIYKEGMKCVWAVLVFYDLCSKSWAQIQFMQSPRCPKAALHSVMCIKMKRALKCFVLFGLGSSWWSTGCASWGDGARPLALQLICSPSLRSNSREALGITAPTSPFYHIILSWKLHLEVLCLLV